MTAGRNTTGGGDGKGLLLALCGFASLSIGDTIIKTIAGAWPGTAVALTRYTAGAVMLGLLLARSEGRRGFVLPQRGWHLLRGLAVGVATVTFFSAIFLMPLAEATAITFTSPMLTVLLAVPLLGERLRAAGLAALALAFAGMIVVLRPSFAELGPVALLPLASALGMSLLMIGNRKVAGSASALAMQFAVAACALPVIALAALAGHLSGDPALHIGAPDWSVIARCLMVAVTASASHWLVYLGVERAGAARVAPMTYVQLPVAGVLGWAAFGDRPDALALLGAGIIVAAGLMLWRSGRVPESLKQPAIGE